jgi:hypothetical protein
MYARLKRATSGVGEAKDTLELTSLGYNDDDDFNDLIRYIKETNAKHLRIELGVFNFNQFILKGFVKLFSETTLNEITLSRNKNKEPLLSNLPSEICNAFKCNKTVASLNINNILLIELWKIGEKLADNKIISRFSFSEVSVIDPRGVFPDALRKDKVITHLNLNNIHLDSSSRFFQSLVLALEVNDTVTDLNLSHNYISDAQAGMLAEMLRSNRAIQHLDLEESFISWRGAKALLNALQTNKSILSIKMSTNDPREDLVDIIKEIGAVLKKNQSSQANKNESTGISLSLKRWLQKAFIFRPSQKDVPFELSTKNQLVADSLNPFDSIIENPRYPLARIYRKNVFSGIADTFKVLVGSHYKGHRYVGVLDYCLLLTPLIGKSMINYARDSENFFVLRGFAGFFGAILEMPRLFIGSLLTISLIPIVVAVHSIAFYKANKLKNAAGKLKGGIATDRIMNGLTIPDAENRATTTLASFLNGSSCDGLVESRYNIYEFKSNCKAGLFKATPDNTREQQEATEACKELNIGGYVSPLHNMLL